MSSRPNRPVDVRDKQRGFGSESWAARGRTFSLRSMCLPEITEAAPTATNGPDNKDADGVTSSANDAFREWSSATYGKAKNVGEACLSTEVDVYYSQVARDSDGRVRR